MTPRFDDSPADPASQRDRAGLVVERVLASLGRSPHADDFAVRGAWSFAFWSCGMPRTTSSLDLAFLGRHGNPAALLRSICPSGGPDGLQWGEADTTVSGVGWTRQTRIRLQAPVQSISIRFVVHMAHEVGGRWHAERRRMISLITGRPLPSVTCLSREWMVAEKAAHLVTYGSDHSRLQDILDLWVLLSTYRFDGGALSETVAAVFQNRDAERMLSRKDGHWEAAFDPVHRSRRQRDRWADLGQTSLGDHAIPGLAETLIEVGSFLMPALRAQRAGARQPGRWQPGHGWLLPRPAFRVACAQRLLPLHAAQPVNSRRIVTP